MEIKEVNDRKLMKMFIGFPYILYRDDPCFVADLRMNQRKIFSGKNPFFAHSRVKLFLAVSRGKAVARIAAIDNTVHNEIYKEKTAFFGFFETVMDYGVFTCLIEKVIQWARSEGFSKLMGPANFTTNDSCGFLVSGFDKMPVIHMPYNKEYYPRFFERSGFRKELDLYAYELVAEKVRLHLGSRLTDRIEKRISDEGISIRQVNYGDLENEMERLMWIYNESNHDNWGFIPLSKTEFRAMAMDLKSMVPETLVLFAENDEKVIGFVVALPDFNQVLRHIPSGRLLPSGIFRFLWYRRKIDNARVLILGVMKEFRNKGIDILFYTKITENLGRLGIHRGEAAYVMGSNDRMNSIMRKIGGTIVKEYRIYSLDLNAG